MLPYCEIVRQEIAPHLVDPVPRAFGWDTANVKMVEPEKIIGSDLRIDCLFYDVRGKPRLVIEAKCLEASLDKHGHVSKVVGYAPGFKAQAVCTLTRLVGQLKV